MRAWPAPDLPRLPGRGSTPCVFDTATGRLQPAAAGPTARLYVCGITPYDATHLGHAATYLAFDTLHRALRDAGHTVSYIQNVTDVDEPLFERAARDGVGWEELGERETELFRSDMEALRVLPPDQYVGAVEAIPEIADLVVRLRGLGATYDVDGDVYFSVTAAPDFGGLSHLDRATMLEVARDNGGDPDRAGKRDPLDPVLWRAARPGEPCWPSPLGPGRPGWHVECAAIALRRLGVTIDVNGGGRDLVFPHHECSVAHAEVATGAVPFARVAAHAGLVGLDGAKMSKSRGNLVFVHRLRQQADPAAIRLAVLAHPWRPDWTWTGADLPAGQERLARWSLACARVAGPAGEPVLAAVRRALADDLDTPAALAALDGWAASDGADTSAPQLVRDTADALLGVRP